MLVQAVAQISSVALGLIFQCFSFSAYSEETELIICPLKVGGCCGDIFGHLMHLDTWKQSIKRLQNLNSDAFFHFSFVKVL